MPGGATIDISHPNMVSYLKEGKKVITARWDAKLAMWKASDEVHLTANHSIRTGSAGPGSADDVKDNVGSLPELANSQI